MQNLIDIKRFEQLKGTGELPSPRGVALAIIRMTQVEDVSMGELARVIRGDPAFVGRLIKAANGLVGHERRAVVSVHEALMMLGLPAVRTMALGFSLLSNYRKGACTAFDYTRYWSSSLLMALAMQALARPVRAMAADEAFSVGLLARIGELALATLYPVEFGRILTAVRHSAGVRQADLEREAFALDHCALSAAMLADWGLPEIVIRAVRHFEQPATARLRENSREHALVQSLVLSRAVAQICLAEESEHAALMPAMLRLAARLGVSREHFVAACDRVASDWVEWGRLLQFETHAAPRFEMLAGLGEQGETAAPAAGAEFAQAADASAPAAPDAGAQPGSLRVLVLAADVAERQRLRQALEQDRLTVFEADSGSQGIEAVVDLQPHMLLVDWQLQDIAGIDVIRSLRETRLGRTIYMLLLIPSEDDFLLEKVLDAGADDFVARPFRPVLLASRLRAARRMVGMQLELEREREEIRRFAAELAISNRRLEEVAMTDALTGFPNRRYALDRLQQEWIAVTRNLRPLSAMIIDLDGLKQLNDAHGHDVGDMVLRQCADALRGVLRAQDVICRTGGDEFLVICPDTDLGAACHCAERLRAAAEALRIETGGPQLRITVSIGVAARDGRTGSLDALIKCADRGSYLSKQRGRNRVSALQREADGD
ncbi:diguanylate cyclase [Thauera sinica]|uniref:diguanylate cyclase n=1 Tax=Thauera sinica TaxID=2665146 RepID=A0ABW1AMR3_9RHOO|nr:diguanylate cyclase [Thauera sp. K11]ATE60638.1 diguanylate cyclase response regulator [Thauera sp. K11]